jgi:hypothetical protein
VKFFVGGRREKGRDDEREEGGMGAKKGRKVIIRASSVPDIERGETEWERRPSKVEFPAVVARVLKLKRNARALVPTQNSITKPLIFPFFFANPVPCNKPNMYVCTAKEKDSKLVVVRGRTIITPLFFRVNCFGLCRYPLFPTSSLPISTARKSRTLTINSPPLLNDPIKT